MIITGIEEQKRASSRLNIYIDNKFAFSLDITLVVEFKLKIHQPITDTLIDEIRQADAFKKSYDQTINYLANRPRSTKEVEQYLKDKLIYKNPDYKDLQSSDEKTQFTQHHLQNIQLILEKLTNQKYVNDSEFASWWVQNRKQFKHTGNRLISAELKNKGIADKDIEEALAKAEEESKGEESDAQILANKYYRKIANLPKDKQQQRLARFLISKGFDWEQVQTVWKHFEGFSEQ